MDRAKIEVPVEREPWCAGCQHESLEFLGDTLYGDYSVIETAWIARCQWLNVCRTAVNQLKKMESEVTDDVH